ncbi:MAG: succinate dehydrogenase, hydrophobic membrane anchor protein [Pseudomonadota bacterium]
MSLQTPLNRVRGLGSAKEGTDHFFRQRLTAVANVPLVLFLVWTLLTTFGAPYEEVRATLASPLTAIALALLAISAAIHMRLGMQVIIEDYVSAEGPKLGLLVLNTFFAILIAAVSLFAILKLSLGG